MSKSIAETFSLIESLRERGEDFCLVTIVRTADATSAKAGAKAVVTSDGAMHGYIGGACVTSAVKRVALEVLQGGAPKLIRVKKKASRRRRRRRSLQILLPERRYGRSVS